MGYTVFNRDSGYRNLKTTKVSSWIFNLIINYGTYKVSSIEAEDWKSSEIETQSESPDVPQQKPSEIRRTRG